MKTSDWLKTYEKLVNVGPDPLTNKERQLKRLPFQEVHQIPKVFQPRMMDFELAASRKHVSELVRALKAQGKLVPITVYKINKKWIILDGHHRLKAYKEAGGKRTHIPVRVFEGTVSEAMHVSASSNSQDKLNQSKEEKFEFAWKMVLAKAGSFRGIAKACSISHTTVKRMSKTLEALNDHYTHFSFEEFTWKQAKHVSLNVFIKPDDNGRWKIAKAKEFARAIVKHFKHMPAQYPDIWAKALWSYMPQKISTLICELEHLQRQAAREKEPYQTPRQLPFSEENTDF